MNKTPIYVIPHWSYGGGAGFYIKYIIEKLKKKKDVKIAGIYAKDYSEEAINSKFFNTLGMLSFPIYSGINPVISLYYLCISLIKVVSIIFKWKKNIKNLENPSAIIFTSSIQAIAIPIVKLILPSCKTVIIVQEHLNFSSILGRLSLRLFYSSDIIISITVSWANHAKQYGLEALVVPNRYDETYGKLNDNINKSFISDLIYVGGDGRIKGFHNFKAVLPLLLKNSDLRIVCLGNYSNSAKKELEKIYKHIESSSKLFIMGNVDDIRPYLRGTKLLLLPIDSPHFCRPAIEAGFFSKPFIIPNFVGLEEFSIDNLNCLKYNKSDPIQLAELIIKTLKSEEKLFSLGCENYKFAEKYLNTNDDWIGDITSKLC